GARTVITSARRRGPRPSGTLDPRVLAGPGTITTIAGLTFAISDELGDVGPGAFGLIAGDTRHLSRLQVLVDGQPLMRLGAGLVATDAARFRAYAVVPGRGPDPPLEVERVRRVPPAGLREGGSAARRGTV